MDDLHVPLKATQTRGLRSPGLVFTLTIWWLACGGVGRGVGRGCRGWRRSLGWSRSLVVIRSTEYVHAAGGTGLLSLEPRAQAAGRRTGQKHKPFKHKVMFSLPHSLLFCLNAGPVFNADHLWHGTVCFSLQATIFPCRFRPFTTELTWSEKCDYKAISWLQSPFLLDRWCRRCLRPADLQE